MRLPQLVRLAVWLTIAGWIFAGRVIANEPANPSATFLGSLASSGLQATWSFASGGSLRLVAENRGTQAVSLTVPAGLVCVTMEGVRVLALREATVAVGAASTVEADLPAVLLERSAASASGACSPITERAARADPLLRALHTRPDVPRRTSQLAVLCLTEDIGLADWEAFLRARKPEDKTGLTPAEVVQAVDALGLLREIAPDARFALARDPELKLRALRNPWCRAKAMQLYGIALPEITSGQAPDLGQLLHTKANDNCPVCRLRSGPPGAAGDL